MSADGSPDLLDLALASGDPQAVFGELAQRNAGVEALVAPGRPALTFDGFVAAIATLKTELNRRGIGRGDRVALVMPNGAEAALASMALMSCAVLVPLNPYYRRDEFDRYLHRLRPRAVIIAADPATPARDAAAALAIPVLEVTGVASAPAGVFALRGGDPAACVDAAWNRRDDVALLLHSSGTTALQKVIPVRWRHLLASARDMRAGFRLAPGDRALHVMPMFHGHGLRAALQQPLCAGSTVVCLPRFSIDTFFADLRSCRATWYSASYTIHKAVLDQLRAHPEQARGVQLRFIRSGSGQLDPAVMEGLETLLDTAVIERYGMSEAGTVACNPLPPGRRKPGSVGLPFGHRIEIVSPDDGRPCAPGEEGEIRINGPSVFDGYLDDPEATAAALVDGWFRSGDLGRLDVDGYLVVTGRLKDMINRGGEKVSPTEIEATLARHPAVRAACVFGMPHPRLGEDIGAAVVADTGGDVDEDDLIAFVSGSLADFKLPRRIFFVNALALGPTHKVDRRATALMCLSAPAPEDAADAGDGADPVLVERLAKLWRDVLARASIPPHRDFFLLGGDSLSAAQLCHRVAIEFGVELRLRAVFREARTLARMAATIAAARTAPFPAASAMPAIAARAPGATIPLSFAQEQIWVHDQLQTASTAYAANRVARLRGPLDVEALKRALGMLVERHEALRTTIAVRGGAPHQVIHPPAPVALPVVEIGGAGDGEIARAVETAMAERFDLGTGPLLRAVLLRLGPSDHVLLLAIHHILIDGGAVRVLTRELAAAYRHVVAGGPPLPPPPALSFADFAVADRARDARDGHASQLAYWRDALAGAVEVDLPADRSRPAVMTPVGRRRSFALSRVDWPRLRHLARTEGSSLFSVLIAAVGLFIHRMTGADDIVLGAPFSRRSRPGMEDVVGLLLNVLPIRVRLEDGGSFRALLRQVTERVLGAIENQDAPLTRILDAAGIRRDPARHPLFQAIVVLAPQETWSIDLPGLASEMIAADDGSTKYDLQVLFLEEGDRVGLVLHHDSMLFAPATIDRFAELLEQVLAAISATPDTPVAALDMLPDAHRRLLLADWSGIAESPPVTGSIAGLFTRQAGSRPDAEAVVCGARRISYARLDAWSTRLAHRLRALGVRGEAVVGLAAGRSPALIAAQLAILKAGGAFLPLDPALPIARIDFMLRDAGAMLVLAAPEAMAALGTLAPPLLRLDPDGADLADMSSAPLDGAAGPRSLAYVMYTSGSTGTPKGVAVEQRGVLRLVRDTGYARFGPEQRFLQGGSVAFDASMFEIWGALLNGGCVVQLPADTPTLQEIARIVVAERVTTCWFTAGLFSQMVDAVPACFAGVEQVLAGGEALSVSHVRKFRAAHPGVRLVNGYGPTEATCFATAHAVAQDAELDPSVPIGTPIANTTAYVLDAGRRLLPVGAAGELCLGGAGVARGYLNHPELTAQRFVANPFAAGDTLYRTGDLVRWRPDGTLQFLGRGDRQVKLRGFRIEPVEIETALQAHAAIAQAVVALRADARGEARLVAFCAASGDAAPDEAALRAFLRDRLPEYMIPAAFAFLPALPLTAQGKVDLAALPAIDIDRSDPARHVAPRTPFEEELVAIWRDVLHLERVGVTDDFFALGGHSLLAVRMLFRVWDVFAVELPLAAVFHDPTIERLALRILERMIARDGVEAGTR